MQSSILTEIFLPLSLAVIMLGMGLSLELRDFRRIIIKPKPVISGLVAQLVLLPAIAFGLALLWPMNPELSVGLILLSACPGGATSNLLAYMARCDAALSISLTALSSLLTIITIPFIVNLGMKTFMEEGTYIKLPVLQTMMQIMIITIIPVAIGMYLHIKRPDLVSRIERPVKIASAAFIALIILGVIIGNRDTILDQFGKVGLPALILNVLTLLMGFSVGLAMKLSKKQSATLSIEAGIQNGTLAIAIASTATMLNNPEIAIAPAVYSLIMFMTGSAAVWYFARILKKE
jgi:bile acid:Na+ symporter, BASS family